jgi:hypothetical protein
MAKIRGISSASRLATRLQHEGVGKVFPLTWALEDHDTPLEEKDKSMKTANFKNLGKFASTLSAIVLLSAVPNVRADTFTVTQLGAGVLTSATTTNVENFNSGLGAGNTTTFNGSGITGTYSGDFQINVPDQFGGAGGTGMYIDTTTPGGNPGSYTLSLNKGVDYFGLWFSALDAGNILQFFDGSTLLFTFDAASYASLVGNCPNAYCGNPSGSFAGMDSGQQYAYLNFLDSTGNNITSIVFTENPAVGQFESDNHAIAQNVATIPGTPLNPTPEPSTLMLFGTGILGVAGAIRRRISA